MSKWTMNIREWLKGLMEHPLFKILLAAIFLWIAYKIRFVLAAVFLSYIVAVSLLPIKKYLVNKKFPKALASITPYLLIVGALAVTLYFITPIITSQFRLLGQNFPQYVGSVGEFLGEGSLRSYVQGATESMLSNLAESLIPVTKEAVNWFTYAIAGTVVSVYVLINHEDLKRWFVKKVDDGSKALLVMGKIENSLGRWMRGQIIIMLIVGVLTWVGLLILGIDFALTLGIIAGFLEFIPYIGPIIASVPAIAVGFSYSPSTALIIALLFAIIQLLENNLIVPGVMKYSVKLNPGLVIVLVLVGTELFGIVGAILAVPIATVSKVIIDNV